MHVRLNPTAPVQCATCGVHQEAVRRLSAALSAREICTEDDVRLCIDSVAGDAFPGGVNLFSLLLLAVLVGGRLYTLALMFDYKDIPLLQNMP